MASTSPISSPDFRAADAPPPIDAYTNDPRLTPLEASILTEYSRLRQNLDELAKSLHDLAGGTSSNLSDGLRGLERKTALVCTALKSSVYGIVLQQQIEGFDGDGPGDGENNG